MKKILLIKDGRTLGAGVATSDEDLAHAIKELSPLTKEGAELKIVECDSFQEEIQKNLMGDYKLTVNVKALDSDSAMEKLEKLLNGNNEITIDDNCYDDYWDDGYNDCCDDEEECNDYYCDDEGCDNEYCEDSHCDNAGNNCPHRSKCDGTKEDCRECQFDKLL